jgi:hypothetical protein
MSHDVSDMSDNCSQRPQIMEGSADQAVTGVTV